MAHTAASEEGNDESDDDELCRLDICPLRSSPPVASQPAVMACPGPNAEHKQVQECHYKNGFRNAYPQLLIHLSLKKLHRFV